MHIQSIGIMSPGSMGEALARQLKSKHYKILTALDNRSTRTAQLSADAGIINVGSLIELTRQADLIISIMNPGFARSFAEELAQAMQCTGIKPLLLDCNAISPDTMKAIHKTMQAVGASCLDGAMMGPPPHATQSSRLFVSGPNADELCALSTPQLTVLALSDRLGDASAIKLCDAVMSKGITALMTQMLMVAQRLGVEPLLREQCEGPRRYFYDWIIKTLPIAPSKSYRWVPELEEMAHTFESVGIPAQMIRGAIEVYDQMAKTPLGKQAPEERNPLIDGLEVARQMCTHAFNTPLKKSPS